MPNHKVKQTLFRKNRYLISAKFGFETININKTFVSKY